MKKKNIQNKLVVLIASFASLLLPTESVLAGGCKVDLKVVNIGGVTKPQYKLGINVGIGGGAPRLYEFDTGGAGFWAAYNPSLQGASQWWGKFAQIGPSDSMSIAYTSGNKYVADLVSTQLALYSPTSVKANHPECDTGSNDIQISQIGTFKNPGKVKKVKAWYKALAVGQPPLEKFFYGDFGGALLPALNTSNQGVYTALNQFKKNADHNGFIVHVGSIDGQNNSSPYVQLGINESDIETFPYLVPMNLKCPESNAPLSCPSYAGFSNTPVNTYLEQQFSGAITVNGNKNPSQLLSPMGVVIDSGAPSPTIWQYGAFSVRKNLLTGVSKVPGTPSIYKGCLSNGESMSIDAQTKSGDAFSTTESVSLRNPLLAIAANYHQPGAPNAGVPYVNTGIQFYMNWDVMYDVTSGLIGFRPAKKNARYSYGTNTVTIPVNNVSSNGQFTGSPGIDVAFMDGSKVGPSSPFTLDTGSTSVVVSTDVWQPPQGSIPLGTGRMVYSSDGVILNGNWYQANVRLGTAEANAIASVPVLVVTSRTCTTNPRDCVPSTRSNPPTNTRMMGVGFAREATSQAVNWNGGVASVPANNPLLHITQINGTAVTPAVANQTTTDPDTLTSGYILTPRGLTIGLTRENSDGYSYVKLNWIDNLAEGGWADWSTVPMEVTLNGAKGSGYVLTDTGIQYMMITPPSKAKYVVNNKCSGDGFSSADCLAIGTRVALSIGNRESGTGANYAFKVESEAFDGSGGTSNPLATPSFAVVNPTPAIFVNTGYHFFNQYAYIYDYVNGYVGFRALH